MVFEYLSDTLGPVHRFGRGSSASVYALSPSQPHVYPLVYKAIKYERSFQTSYVKSDNFAADRISVDGTAISAAVCWSYISDL